MKYLKKFENNIHRKTLPYNQMIILKNKLNIFLSELNVIYEIKYYKETTINYQSIIIKIYINKLSNSYITYKIVDCYNDNMFRFYIDNYFNNNNDKFTDIFSYIKNVINDNYNNINNCEFNAEIYILLKSTMKFNL